jgi:hypothetical protein
MRPRSRRPCEQAQSAIDDLKQAGLPRRAEAIALTIADAPAGDAQAQMKTTGIPTAHAAAFAQAHSDTPEA